MDEPVPERDDRVMLVASATGLLAQIELGRVVVLELPDVSAVAEIGLAGDVDDHDVAFIGSRLVVLSRAGNESTLHSIDPRGPTKLGEAKFRGAARIVARTGEALLVTAGTTTSIVELTRDEPSVHVLALRGTITAAGTIDNNFLVCISAVLEEWDPSTRKPARRLRIDTAIDPWLIGGNSRRVWIVSRRHPDQIDVLNLEKRSSRRIELPEVITRVVPHPGGDMVVAVAGTRGYLVSIDRQHEPVLPIEQAISDVAWLGRRYTLAVRPLDGAIGLLSLPGDDEIVVAKPPPPPPRPAVAPPPPPEPEPPPPTESPSPSQWTREDIAARLAAWRQRVSERGQPVPVDAAPPPPVVTLTAVHPGGWRGELASWAATVCARSYREMPRLDCGVLDDIAVRLELRDECREALALLYGAYLNGMISVPPIVLASCVRWQWQEALGIGRLAASGAFRWRRGQIGLFIEVIAALDERPPLCGSFVEGEGHTEKVVGIVAADAAGAKVGTLFVRNARGDRAPARFALEAKLRGLAIIVTDAAEAARLGIDMHS